MEGSKIDSIFTNFDLPVEDARYRPFVDDKDNELRIITGDGSLDIQPDATYGSKNMFITTGGALAKRPAFVGGLFSFTGATIASKKIVKQWYYETLPGATETVHAYSLSSVFNPATLHWEMYYDYLTTGGGSPTIFTNLRSVNDSTSQHQVVVVRGLAYIRSTPDSSTGELLGTIVFDGSGGTAAFKPWGLLGPTTPARVVGWAGRLATAETSADTTWSVTSLTAPPTAPFVLQCEYEMVNVTAVAGSGPWTLTVTRAHLGTVAAAHLVNTTVLYRNWSASTHKVNLKYGWEYTYCYKSITGHYSNRANIEFNPDMLPSNTGPFPDLIPKITVQGHADTTNIPYIVIGRTTDGGGNFAELEIIANTGAGSITYEDKSLGTGASGTTFNDPLPDDKLQLALPMPSLTSNSPPPTVNPPQVVGVNTPRRSSKMVAFSSRIWFAIDNVVHYSSDEETLAGIPEECFMSGVNGGFQRFSDAVISLEATNASLYLLGTRNTYILNGNNKETFYTDQLSSGTPISPFGFEASVSFLGRVAFIAADGRVCVITDTYVDVISEAMRGVFTPPLSFQDIQLTFYASQNNQWLMIHVPFAFSQGELSGTFIYDWARSTVQRRDLWFPPWLSKLQTIGIIYNSSQSILLGSAYDSGGGVKSSLVVSMEPPDLGLFVTGDDYIHSGSATKYLPTWQAKVHPFKNPPGNHINTHAVPHTTTTAHYIRLDYSGAAFEPNIGMRIFNDALSYGGSPLGTDITAKQTAPTRRPKSVGYVTKEWHLYSVGQDFGLFINAGDIGNSHVRLERLSFGVVPSAGPDSSGDRDA